MNMKHSVPKKTAVLSNPQFNSAKQSTQNYFEKYKKSKNKIKITLKKVKNMAKTDVGAEAAVPKKNTAKHQGSKEKQKPPTKIIIRHLPPTMTEEDFLKQIDPLPPHDFYYFATADWSLGFDATCRAYITLKNYDDVFLFRDRFDGYVFVDAKGNEYAAIVEFAPFQGIVKNKSRRTDNKVNTIEEETHYQQFLVKLTEEREMASKGGETKMEFNLNPKKEEITSTPLLQYLANKKEKRRLEAKKRVEEKRKQRDDESEKRRLQAKNKEQQVTRIMTGNSNTEKPPEVVLKKEPKVAVEGEEKQSSRSKRRNERNQKRQEAFLQRKMQDKTAKSAESRDPVIATENYNEEKTEQSNQHEKKEGKRERDRERNRVRRERRVKEKEMIKVENKNERRNSGNERRLSDSVKVPSKILTKHVNENQKEQESSGKKNSSDNRESKADEEMKKQRAAEERRIRNKDRPSIAIYQPKARLRQSEESDTGGNNSVGRQSDGERFNDTKKGEEVQQTKKVSRYSERRKRSTAVEKRKSSVTDEENIPQAQPMENEAITTTDNQ